MAVRRIPSDIKWKNVTVTIKGKKITYLVPDFGEARNRIRSKKKNS